MENNYEFWDCYLKNIQEVLFELCEQKEELTMDLHIHSNYSADGKQSVKQILESTKDLFDVIAITDHDSLKVYDELYDILKNGLTKPIIIPGIEFTIDNRDYGNQCHMLQLFINPKDEDLIKQVTKNYNAMFNRSKIQFKRLQDNKAIDEILYKNDIDISYSEYIDFIDLNKMEPEYDTLCIYLMEKFKKNNITTFDILDRLERYNEDDCCKDRCELKRSRFEQLRRKYSKEESNFYNVRLLLSMLAVKEVDDDWWGAPSSGSLSVNSYGQLKIDELNTKYITFFAHPTETKLNVVEKILKEKTSIVGLERNKRNNYENIDNFNKILAKNKLLEIFGSDSHDNKLTFYDDLSFYEMKSNDLKKILKEVFNNENEGKE